MFVIIFFPSILGGSLFWYNLKCIYEVSLWLGRATILLPCNMWLLWLYLVFFYYNFKSEWERVKFSDKKSYNESVVVQRLDVCMWYLKMTPSLIVFPKKRDNNIFWKSTHILFHEPTYFPHLMKMLTIRLNVSLTNFCCKLLPGIWPEFWSVVIIWLWVDF